MATSNLSTEMTRVSWAFSTAETFKEKKEHCSFTRLKSLSYKVCTTL